MITLSKYRHIQLQITVYRHDDITENFDGSAVYPFLVSNDAADRRRFIRPTGTITDGKVIIDIPANSLSPGLYGLELIWYKNDPLSHCYDTCRFASECGYGQGICRLDPPCSPKHPMHGYRDIMRCLKQKLFCITDIPEEDNVEQQGDVIIKQKLTACVYGFDGLSAYEIAVMEGETTLTEKEWIKHIMSTPDILSYWDVKEIVRESFGF